MWKVCLITTPALDIAVNLHGFGVCIQFRQTPGMDTTLLLLAGLFYLN